jgi:hypothetical protein
MGVKAVLSAAGRMESDRRVEAKCADFEVLAWEIMYAGLASPPDILTNPFLTLHDNAGQLWKKQAQQMNAADVVEFIDHRYGPLYVQFLRDHFNGMTTH